MQLDRPGRDGDFLYFKSVEDHVSTKCKKLQLIISCLLVLYEIGEQAQALAFTDFIWQVNQFV